MKDYLASIVAKELNLTEGIRPRLSSRFEPAPEANGPFTGVYAEGHAPSGDDPLSPSILDEALSSAPTHELSPKAYETPADQKAAHNPMQADPGLTLDSPPERRIGQPILQDRTPESISLQQSFSHPQTDQMLQPAAHQEFSLPLPLRTSVESRPALRIRISPKETGGPLASGEEESGERFYPARQILHDASADGVSQLGPSQSESRITSVDSSIVQPRQLLISPHKTQVDQQDRDELGNRDARLATRNSQPATHNPQPATRPIIRVTIGRVEVRATLSSTQIPPAPPRSVHQAGLSLEDYLKQREGGKR